MNKFKVKDLIEVCGDMYFTISDFRKRGANLSKIIYWQGWKDDYFKERPFGDYDVMYIDSTGTKSKTTQYSHGDETFEYGVLDIRIEKQETSDYTEESEDEQPLSLICHIEGVARSSEEITGLTIEGTFSGIARE